MDRVAWSFKKHQHYCEVFVFEAPYAPTLQGVKHCNIVKFVTSQVLVSKFCVGVQLLLLLLLLLLLAGSGCWA